MAILEIHHLKKSFMNHEKKPVAIIDVPNFAVGEAEQMALEGRSGCGKTTFINLIAGIHQPDSGKILFRGQNVANLPESKRDAWRACNIGYVFQTFNLLQGYTALENVLLGMAFGKGIDEDRGRTLLERMDLEKQMNYRPRQMSIGQQQRVAVARALANHPALVLADEPTGNLDYKHAQETVALIQEVCAENKAALLLVSHSHDILGKFRKMVPMADINKAGAQ